MAIFDFFKALFKGEAGDYLVETLWPWIQSILETIALTFMILPLTMMKYVNEVIAVFSGTKNIENVTTVTRQVSFDEWARMPMLEQIRVQAAGMQYIEKITEEVSFLEYFINQPFITRAFWGITLIAMAVCLGFSIVAVLRSMGDMQQNRPLGKVIGSIGKAMLTFLLVPFVCISAIWLTTVVIRQTEELFSGESIYGEEVSVEGAILISSVRPEHVRMWDVTRVWKMEKLPGGTVLTRGYRAGFGPRVTDATSAMRRDSRYRLLYDFSDAHGIKKYYPGWGDHSRASSTELNGNSYPEVITHHLDHFNEEIMTYYAGKISAAGEAIDAGENGFRSSGENLPTATELTRIARQSVDGTHVALLPYQSQKEAQTWKVLAPMLEKYLDEALERLEKYKAPAMSELSKLEEESVLLKDELDKLYDSLYALQREYETLTDWGDQMRNTIEYGTAAARYQEVAKEYSLVVFLVAYIKYQTETPSIGAMLRLTELSAQAGVSMLDLNSSPDVAAKSPNLSRYSTALNAARGWSELNYLLGEAVPLIEAFDWYVEQITGKGVRLIEERRLMDEDEYGPEDQRAQYDSLVEEYMFGHKGVDFGDMKDIRYDFDVFSIFFGGIGIFSSIAAWFMLILLIMIVLVFIRRIFEVVVLYVVSPFFVSAIPLDDGKRFGGWRDAFVSRLLAGFGSIFMLRIFILMLPTIWSPDLTLSSNSTADTLMKLFFMAGGMFTIWKSHTLISTIINPQGAAAEQESSAGGLAAMGMAFGAVTSTVGGAWNLGTGAYSGTKASYGGGDSGSSSSSDPGPQSSGNANPNL